MIWYVNDIPQKQAHTHTWYAIISTIAPLPSALETKDSAVSVIMFYRLRIDVKTSEVKRKFKTKFLFILNMYIKWRKFPLCTLSVVITQEFFTHAYHWLISGYSTMTA